MRTVGVLMNTFEGTDSRYAGGHVHTFEVLARLRDFRIVVFAPAYARQIVAERLPGASFVATPSLPAETEKSPYLFLHRAVTSLGCVRRLRACDLVYATSPALPDILPAAFAKPGRVTVCIFHVLPLPWRRSGSLLRNVIAFVAEAVGLALAASTCRSVIVGTRHAGRDLRRRGFRQRLFVTTNGVEHPSSFPPATAARAIYVGRLHPTKGIDDLLDAWAGVVAALPAARLTIVGDGPPAYRHALVARAERLGIASAVDFVGRVDDAERLALLQASTVFAFPSYEEGWGIALAEAMAAGVPCVAYALPVYVEVFPRGLVTVPTGDVAALSRRIADVLSDDALRLRLSADARVTARTFSWEQAATVERDALDFARNRKRTDRGGEST